MVKMGKCRRMGRNKLPYAWRGGGLTWQVQENVIGVESVMKVERIMKRCKRNSSDKRERRRG